MLTKLLDSTSFFNPDEIQVTILEPGKIAGLVKQAAHSDVQNYVAGLTSDPSKLYVHINAMGAGEYYGPNKNGDYFPEAQLIKYHKTFEDTGYVYKHHINKDPKKSFGKVVFSLYNQEMHRVELIAWIDRVRGADIVGRIEDGDYPMTSMACKTPFDVCSICSNKASTRSQYCSHLSNELLKIYPNGQQVMSMNVGPLKFFDISIVIRPADVTSSVLAKVASVAGEQTDAATVGSAEMAEREGVDESFGIKSAAFKKLSELIKKIEGGQVTKLEQSAKSLISETKDLPISIAPELLKLGTFNQIVNALAKLGINPSSQFYMALLNHVPEVTDFVRTRMPDIEGPAMLEGTDFHHMHPEVVLEEPPSALLAFLKRYQAFSSLDSDIVEKRAYYWEQAAPTPPFVKQVPAQVPSKINTTTLAASAAGAMILNHYITKDKDHRDLIDKLLTLFFGAALISKMSVNELAKLHSNSSLDKVASMCNLSEEFVVSELLALK